MKANVGNTSKKPQSMALSKHILSLFLVITLAHKLVHSQPDVTSFQIDTFRPSADGLTYERGAFVPPGSRSLKLIPHNPSGIPWAFSVGRVVYSNPVKFSDRGRQASFETTIRFKVTPINDDPVDGMTFFIVPVNSTLRTGGEGQNLGIFNAVPRGVPIFAVEFDVYVNSYFDPNYRHIGIDINSLISANTTSFERAVGRIVTARINYDAPTRKITVFANYGSETLSVEYVYNLKDLLPQQVHVGLSASTGPSSAADYDVFQWYFTSTMVNSRANEEDDAYIKESVQ